VRHFLPLFPLSDGNSPYNSVSFIAVCRFYKCAQFSLIGRPLFRRPFEAVRAFCIPVSTSPLIGLVATTALVEAPITMDVRSPVFIAVTTVPPIGGLAYVATPALVETPPPLIGLVYVVTIVFVERPSLLIRSVYVASPALGPPLAIGFTRVAAPTFVEALIAIVARSLRCVAGRGPCRYGGPEYRTFSCLCNITVFGQ
jgi:hypothetical protein